MEPLLLTAEEAAEMLNVGRCKVYDLLRTGQLETAKTGRLRRIPVDAERAFAHRLVEDARG